MFERKNNRYNLRNFQELATKRKRTVKMGFENLNYRFIQLWSILLENLRQINLLVVSPIITGVETLVLWESANVENFFFNYDK